MTTQQAVDYFNHANDSDRFAEEISISSLATIQAIGGEIERFIDDPSDLFDTLDAMIRSVSTEGRILRQALKNDTTL